MTDSELNRLEQKKISEGTCEMIGTMLQVMVAIITLLMYVSGLGFGNILHRILNVVLCVVVVLLVLVLVLNVSTIRLVPIMLLVAAHLAIYWGMQYGYLIFGTFVRIVVLLTVPVVYMIVGYGSCALVPMILGCEPQGFLFGD